MASLLKLVVALICIVLLLAISSVDSTWNNAEGGNIAIPKDKISWPQVFLVKTVLLLLVILWFYGMLPVMVEVPLKHYVERRSIIESLDNPKKETYEILCKLMAAVTSEPVS
ncbi:uncharacterized protein [Periplaneta americana]|uniref:uncharacterized protein n=1 Tax=Periplaneta americana TaxID=6978 RepID=UPI0037E70DEE